MNKLLALKNQLNNNGIKAEIQTACAENYFDGTQRGYYYDVLRIEYTPGTLETIDKFARRHGCKITRYNIYAGAATAATNSDAENAENAIKTANIFLDTFWNAIHAGKNQEIALAEGRAALANR